MSFFDDKFKIRENKIRRNYDIEDSLYSKLSFLSKKYEATIPDLINACINELIITENVILYQKDINERLTPHTFYINENNVKGLEKLNDKYGVSIRKLVNISLHNIIDKC